MGKIRLINLTTPLKKGIRGKVLASAKTLRPQAKPYSPEEAKSYLRMYISGYGVSEIAEHFEVLETRVRGAMEKGGGTRAWKNLNRINKINRLGRMKLMTIDSYWRNDLS